MHISPINNVNFNGKIKNTPVLEKLIHSSSNDTLAKFSEVVERAAKVNDNYRNDIKEISTTHKEEIKELTSVIQQNTLVIQKLCDSLDQIQKGD